MGKTELTEYTVVEAFTRFNFVPIFGTAGSRPGQKFRPIHELLRSLVLAFRHLDSTLPAQEKAALMSLLGVIGESGDVCDFAKDLRSDLGLPEDGSSAHEAGDSCQVRSCKQGMELVVKLVRQLSKERAVSCALSLRSGSNIFESEERKEDEAMF